MVVGVDTVGMVQRREVVDAESVLPERDVAVGVSIWSIDFFFVLPSGVGHDGEVVTVFGLVDIQAAVLMVKG